MRKDPRTTAITPMAYQLPEAEYRALIRARDHLRLLARLIEPGGFAEDEVLPLSAFALARCFQRFSDDLDDIVSVARWPSEQRASTAANGRSRGSPRGAG